MTERGEAYNTPDPCAESLDKMTRRLTGDLRARVRRLAFAEPLSPEWVEMVDGIIQPLASVAVMEAKDCTKKEGSIWEREELCVRYIIEEGKINLLTRSMSEFKKVQYAQKADGAKQADADAAKMRTFELGMGSLLKCCFTAVEALQTLDLTSLIEYFAMVLRHANIDGFKLPVGDITQESMVIQYLALLLGKLEQLTDQEETIMTQLTHNEIFPLVLTHYEQLNTQMDKETQESAALFLAAFFDSEHFSAHKTEFITAKTKPQIVALNGLVKDMIAADPLKKKTLRPLSDTILRYK